MASGGARGRSGPAPDPNALRRERKDDQAGWITLPAERLGSPPEWPLIGQSTREADLWVREWTRPQATEWERLGLEMEVALYVRVFTEAELPGASGKSRDLVRMYRENLGLSVPGLTRHRWKIAGSSPAATAPTTTSAARPSRGRSSARDRLKVVEPAKD